MGLLYHRLVTGIAIKEKFAVRISVSQEVRLYYVQDSSDDEQTALFWILVQEIVAELQEKIKNTRWENLIPIIKEFSIEEPEEYD